jgi:hypothetical protein
MDRQGLISLHQANGGHEANAANEGKGGSYLHTPPAIAVWFKTLSSNTLHNVKNDAEVRTPCRFYLYENLI